MDSLPGQSDEVCESGITMVDVLKEEEELENDAEAVLGAGDDSSCSYSQGYMKRQPLYACTTCCPENNDVMGGICLACSYHCHEGHELIELYTKRYFKCDCSNSKFPSGNQCKLEKEKEALNGANIYNQNFKGKYCICSRPYPDPDDTFEDSMIQCVICEDWYHGRHLEVETLPSDDDFSEMICQRCSAKLPFLQSYLDFTTTATKSNGTVEIDVISPKNEEKDQSPKGKMLDVSESVDDKEESTLNGCKLKNTHDVPSHSGALFLLENWRRELCHCGSCCDMYKNMKVEFLKDSEDTVHFYESEGRAKRQSSRGIQRELDALSSLDRITRTEVVHEYNNLSSSLREYLKKFAENGKVVKGEDIQEFFSQLSANKRQRVNGRMQYFCK